MRFDQAAANAAEAAGLDRETTWSHPYLLLDPQDPSSRTRFPRVAIDSEGEFLWSWGARRLITFGDLERAQDAGFVEGHLDAVYLEQPAGGDGGIPLWDDVLAFLQVTGDIASIAQLAHFAQHLLKVLRAHYRRWQDRGAFSPYAFLDVVLARDEWDRRSLARLLRLTRDQATDLLTSFGYEATDSEADLWVMSTDPDKSDLRRQIRRKFFPGHVDDQDSEQS